MDNQYDVKTPEYVSLQFELAGLGSRSLAFMIDQCILTVANILIALITFFIVMGLGNVNTESLPVIVIAVMVLLLFVVNFGYYVFSEAFFAGKTIGKKLTGIRVIQENGHGITFLSSFIRNFLRLIDSLPAGYVVGILFIYGHPKHKRLGDIVAGTIVVHERKAKKAKKQTPIEREMAKRDLHASQLPLSEWDLKVITDKEWNILRTYANRVITLNETERHNMTKRSAEIIYPKLGLSMENKGISQIEDELLIIYIQLKDEWEFDM